MSELIALLAYLSALLLVAGLTRLRPARPARARLARLLASARPAPRPSGFDRHIRPTIVKLPARFAFLRPLVRREWVARRLVHAGQPYGLGVEEFFGLQILGALVGLALGFWVAILGVCGGIVTAPVLVAVGFLAPNWWLSGKASKRQNEITLALPTVLDLLVVCIQAGLGFDQALASITQRLKGPLAEEIAHYLREVNDLGEPRRMALTRLVERTTSKDLQTFVAALVQAEDLGVPLATTLEVQAQEMRFRRGQRAKDLAAKASPRIALVVVMLVAPSALCLLVTAMASSLLRGGSFTMFGR